MTPAEAALADLLADLRRSGRQQSGLDAALVPADGDSAYRVAAGIAARLGYPVAGWKIAAWKTDLQRQLRTDSPIYGRVFAPFLHDAPVEMDARKLLHVIMEAEFVVRLGADLPVRAEPWTRSEVEAAVASVHPGIEVAECRFIRDAAFPPITAILADGSGSGSLVVGPAIPDWRSADLAGQTVRLFIDGVERGSGRAGDLIDHPLEPVTWLANELSRKSIGLTAGQVISTGTLTGMVRGRPGETHVADFDPFGEVRVSFAS